MIRKVAAKKNESLQIIGNLFKIFPNYFNFLDLFNLFTLNPLVKETTLGTPGVKSGGSISEPNSNSNEESAST